MPQPTLDEKIAALKPKATDEFSRSAIEGARRALADCDNPLRLNFFSTAMRILLEHMMETLSPNDEVTRSPWFKPEREGGQPTRWQKIIFAIQGGLPEAFVTQQLKVDPLPLRKRLLEAINELSKHVHGREYSVVSDRDEQDAMAEITIAAVAGFLDAINDCRSAVLEPIAEALDEAAVDAMLSETLGEVDELASHYTLEEVYIDRIVVLAIGVDTITYRATGSVAVVLQWGSNSDVRRGDGAELEQSFPFYCDILLPLDDLWNLDLAETTYGVDTQEWHDAMGPDD